MAAKKITILTIPLFPYLQAGRKKPLKTKRIRPQDSLDLKGMLREMKKSSVMGFDIDKKPWLLTSVYSSYTPDIHVMLLEASANRYIAGPEKISNKEGEHLMKMWAAILEFIGKRENIETVHCGYNWSPRSWGIEEEKTGFQSLPTKWHPHIWAWPALSAAEGPKFDNLNKKEEWYVKQINMSSLSIQEKRLLGENDYAKPFGLLIKKRLTDKFSKDSLLFKLFPLKTWNIDSRGLVVQFNESITAVLKSPGFFTQVLKPLAAMLEEIIRELTDCFTELKCRDIDRILRQTEKSIPKDLEILRAAPQIRDKDTVKKIFRERKYPAGLFDALWQPVWNRCREEGDPVNWWRKGFAYALILYGPSKVNRGQLRIMPGVYVGSGGIVEAEGYLIKRPEDKQFSHEQIQRKSQDLRDLAKNLKTSGF